MEEGVISKFFVTERYDPEHYQKLKQAINKELATREINKEVSRRHYREELNLWQKRVFYGGGFVKRFLKVRSYRSFEKSIEKVNTHPKVRNL